MVRALLSPACSITAKRASLSKVPVIGDIPILGNLFKSTQFQKQETELVFIVTADLVKPVNRDDLPTMRSMDGLKNGSPLGLEPKGEGISGASGFSEPAARRAPARYTRSSEEDADDTVHHLAMAQRRPKKKQKRPRPARPRNSRHKWVKAPFSPPA